MEAKQKVTGGSVLPVGSPVVPTQYFESYYRHLEAQKSPLVDSRLAELLKRQPHPSAHELLEAVLAPAVEYEGGPLHPSILEQLRREGRLDVISRHERLFPPSDK